VKSIKNALIIGAALRAFKTLGIVQHIVDQGWCADGCDRCGLESLSQPSNPEKGRWR